MEKTTNPAGQTTVIAGNNLVYRVIARNLGPDSTTGVVVEDTLPVNTVFISAVPNPGAPDGACTFTLATRLVRCTWANAVPPGPSTGLGTNARYVDITIRTCSGILCNTVLQNRALVRDNNTQLGAQIYRQEFTTRTGDFVLINTNDGPAYSQLDLRQQLHQQHQQPRRGPHHAGHAALGQPEHLRGLRRGGDQRPRAHAADQHLRLRGEPDLHLQVLRQLPGSRALRRGLRRRRDHRRRGADPRGGAGGRALVAPVR